MAAEYDPKKARFPLCITWTPLPCISWFVPCIGHTGICGTDGVIYDFAGPYTISKDNFAFGECYKYVRLEITDQEKFNEDIDEANVVYKRRNHNLCCDNCHSHVAHVLNSHNYMGRSNWTMIGVWWLLITSGSYVSCATFIRTYLVFTIIVGIIVACSLLL